MTRAARTLLTAAIAGCVAAGALEVLLLQRAGAAAGLVLPVAAIVAVVVARRPIVGLQLALLAVPLEYFSVKLGGSAGLSATELLLLLTAAAAAARWAIAGDRPHVHPALWALAALCLAVALSYVAATDRFLVVKILVMWSAFTVIGILVSGASEHELERVLACLALAGGLTGFLAVAGGANQTLVAGGAIATNRAQASFSQPNTLAFFLSMAIPPAIVLATRGDLRRRIVMGVAAVGASWGLLLSLSRTGLVGTLVALGVLLLWPPFRRIAALAVAALLVFSLFNFQAIQSSRQFAVVGDRLATLGRSNQVSQDPRLLIWGTTPRIFADHPLLGVGAGNFSLVAPAYGLVDPQGLPYDHAHDVPLTIAAEVGLPGIAALAWLISWVARLAWRAVRRRGDPRVGALGLALAASMGAVSVTSLGDYPPRTNAIAGTFVALVGVLVALDRRARQRSSS